MAYAILFTGTEISPLPPAANFELPTPKMRGREEGKQQPLLGSVTAALINLCAARSRLDLLAL